MKLKFKTQAYRIDPGELGADWRPWFKDNLFAESGELDQYRDGFTINQIDATNDTVEFTNGLVLTAGEASGDVSEGDIRRIQIRETIKAHLDRESRLQ